MDTDVIIQWALNNYWIPLSVFVTIAAVQMFKVPFKYYLPDLDHMTRKISIFLFAFFAGYFITLYLMTGDVEQKKWAVTIALTNPAIYYILLVLATKKRWLGIVALLKGRKFVVRGGREKVVDDDDKTIMVGRSRNDDTAGD